MKRSNLITVRILGEKLGHHKDPKYGVTLAYELTYRDHGTVTGILSLRTDVYENLRPRFTLNANSILELTFSFVDCTLTQQETHIHTEKYLNSESPEFVDIVKSGDHISHRGWMWFLLVIHSTVA